jgi:GNAT superfamily N-acetyltransferase
VRARRSSEDARTSLLSLSAKGRAAFTLLDSRSRAEVSAMLGALAAPDQARLVGAMRTVATLLGEEKRGEIRLRTHRPGDLGWIVHRHGALYFEEYGWDERFEALVAGVAQTFIARYDAQRERCWIAELDGEPVGSVLVVKARKGVAQLRLLLVEPRARGRGIGRRLVQECVAFARASGYRELVLWTQSNLAAAREIYRGCGFELKKTEPHSSFGVALTGEYWALRF